MKARYTQFILTLIAALLLWNMLGQRPPAAHAQTNWKYRAAVVYMIPPEGEHYQRTISRLSEELNKAAAGGELFAFVPVHDSNAVYAIFKER